jgi:SpoIID/LytB domain protein
VRVAGHPASAAAFRQLAFGAALAMAALTARPALQEAAAQPAGRAAPGPAYRLIALPSGRVVAEARRDVLSTPVAPGSLMKLAALVALYEQGLGDVRVACTRRVVVDGKTLTCVHPDLHRPLSPADAVGYSCNTYFGTLALRISRQSLDSVLVRLGLGPIAPGSPVASAAVGLGGVRATPVQWLEAFLRVVGVSPVSIALPDAARRALRSGTELAARSGTASALGAAGFSGLAKTGTAPMPGGGTMGLVTAVVSSELPTHAIVVLAPGAAGGDAAAIAADLLRRHGVPHRTATVRVGVARREGGYDVRAMPIEEYVSAVVAGEMNGIARPAALEAMAITARTFLEANRGRHDDEGFDVCDLSHCQVLGRAGASGDAAARATAGLVLLDGGEAAEVYYSASCGGHTEKPSSVWPGARDAPHLPARPDEACAGEPSWRTEIAEPDLRRVLQAAGLRGDTLSRLAVASRDVSGRAARLAVGGMVPDHLDAGAFRMSAGRVLGWQTIGSTLFDVRRTASGYVFSGRGRGHGVGLCVLGAVNRARRGAGRDEILAAYFPGLEVAGEVAGRVRTSSLAAPASGAQIRITLPEAEREHLGEIRTLAGDAVRDLAAWLGRSEPAAIECVFYPTVEAYMRATGQPWWTAGTSRGARIDLLPRSALAARGILASTLRHEITHVLADPALAGRPLWVREGLAVYLARERPAAATPGGARTKARAGACPSDDELRAPASAEAWRRAYEAAGACVARALESGLHWKDLR